VRERHESIGFMPTDDLLLASVGFMPAGPRLFSYQIRLKNPFLFLPPSGRKKQKGEKRAAALVAASSASAGASPTGGSSHKKAGSLGDPSPSSANGPQAILRADSTTNMPHQYSDAVHSSSPF
jgi:hypothetical protein